MTGLPPSDPRRRRTALGSDEMIAIAVAFAAVGSLLFWGLTRQDGADTAGVLGPLSAAFAEASPAASIGDQISNAIAPSPNPTAVAPAPGTETTVTATGETIVAQPGETVIPPAGSTVIVPPGSTIIVPGAATATTQAGATSPVVVTTTPSPDAAPIAVPDPNLPAIVVPAPGAAVTFSDVPQDYWAYPFISALAQRGIIKGFNDGTFKPDQPVTRAEYASLIQNIFERETIQTPIAFKDVQADYWAAPAIDTAVQTGFLKGYPDGLFRATDQIPKVQVLVSLVNGLRLPQVSAPADVVNRFPDADRIPGWAVPATAAATQSNLIVNHPNVAELTPDRPSTRAEVAATLYQALVAAGKLEPVQSDFIVRP